MTRYQKRPGNARQIKTGPAYVQVCTQKGDFFSQCKGVAVMITMAVITRQK